MCLLHLYILLQLLRLQVPKAHSGTVVTQLEYERRITISLESFHQQTNAIRINTSCLFPVRPYDKPIPRSAVLPEWCALPLQLGLLEDASERLCLVLNKSVNLAAAIEVFWAIVLRVFTGFLHISSEHLDDMVGKSHHVILNIDNASAYTSITGLSISGKLLPLPSITLTGQCRSHRVPIARTQPRRHRLWTPL